MLLPLFIQASVVVGSSAPPTGPAVYPVQLSPGYYEYFPVGAFANSTVVQYSARSNASISTAFMTGAQFQDFVDGNGPVSNSVTYHNGKSDDETLQVSPGSYALLVYAYAGAANLTLTVSVFPNNPLGYGQLEAPEPSGIASFGLANSSGVDNPYEIASTDVIGLASISSMEALNSSASSVSVNPSGATLQLNSMLVVEEGSAGSQVYWCQNTPDFVTAASQVAPSDNVWNASASGFLSNDTVTSQGGMGYVSGSAHNGTGPYFYGFEGANSTYALPLGLVLLMNATAEPGTGVVVRFGALVTGGVSAMPGTDWFDNVTIHDPAARSAYFLTDGNYSTPVGSFYDTELVFGGEGNGESTTFTSLAASLGLYYANGTASTMSSFPSYFSFGQDTQEGAYNLKMGYLGNGEAELSVGTPNYDYLGQASGAYSLKSAETSLEFPGYAPVTSTTSGAATTSTTPVQSSTGANANGIPEFPYQAAATTAFVGLMALAYLLVRRRPTGRPTAAAGPSLCGAQAARPSPWVPC